MSDLLAGNVGHPSLSGLTTGEGMQKNALGQNKSGALLSPAVGGLLRGLVSPIDLADKYIAAPLTRMIPESLGGNPNEQPYGLGNMIAAHTAAPEGAIDDAAGQVGTFAGGALGMGKFLKSAGLLTKIPGVSSISGMSRVGSFLSNAGEITRSEERRVGKECRSRWSPYH